MWRATLSRTVLQRQQSFQVRIQLELFITSKDADEHKAGSDPNSLVAGIRLAKVH